MQAGSGELLHFKACGSWFGNRRKAAEFLRNETLRYLLAVVKRKIKVLDKLEAPLVVWVHGKRT